MYPGANEIVLDLMTRVAVDHLRNLGRTFRLLVDGFSHKMTSEVCRDCLNVTDRLT